MNQLILNDLLSQLINLLQPSLEITTLSANIFVGPLVNVIDNKYLHMKNLKLIQSESLITPQHVSETLVNTEKIKTIKVVGRSSYYDSLYEESPEKIQSGMVRRKFGEVKRRRSYTLTKLHDEDKSMQIEERYKKYPPNVKKSNKYSDSHKYKFVSETWKEDKDENMLIKVMEATRIFDIDKNKRDNIPCSKYEPDKFYDSLSGKGMRSIPLLTG